MKKVLSFIIGLSFLLQSCYSYKKIDLKTTSLKPNKVYKINQGKTKYKGRLIGSNDSIITVKQGKVEKQIPIESISIIKKRKFSTTKTVLLPISIVIGATAIILSTGDIVKVGLSKEIPFPP
jgi:hypothetical protein